MNANNCTNRSPEDITRRIDGVITDIREKYHRKCFGTDEQGDVLVVAHGHVLRALAMRWVGKPLQDTSFILEAGGVGTLRYVFLFFSFVDGRSMDWPD